MGYLLHAENFSRPILNGRRIENWLQARAQQIAVSTEGVQDVNVSIVVRSRNDSQHIQRLFADIKAQIFNGEVEIIVVDTSSRDDTVPYAESQGAKIINLKQEEFTYPKALNLGFQAAKYPWVATLVGHSSLSSRLFLRSVSYWANQDDKLGGIYSLPLANWNASIVERLENILIRPSVWKESKQIKELSIGIMGANCSVVKRDIWERLGGYDERYAGGGEDRAFAGTMLANGVHIVREPLCSVFHSHGLSAVNNIRQWLHWGEVAKKALPFETAKVHKRRPDLR
ncbi:MAG TPA: glycosyltransferase family A protein [Candidatus Saccharimonadales bacterium]|nr:glycosyltransferase family A protein [Candidatus Saccharimonadales bacterium]